MAPPGWNLVEKSQNMLAKFSENNERLFVLIHSNTSCGLSKSGKSTIIASTEKWSDVLESGFYLLFMLFTKAENGNLSALVDAIRTGVDIEPEMGFTIDMFDEEYIRFTFDCKNEFGLTKNGKSMTIASSDGMVALGETGAAVRLHALRKSDRVIEGPGVSAKKGESNITENMKMKISRKRPKSI